MCDTCGCGQPDEAVTIRKPGEEGHSHPHHHGHNHNHPHDHSHTHNHSENRTVVVETDILTKNNLRAERNRGNFEAKNIFVLNLVSSPGSGKTTILEKTISSLKNQITCAVIEGDQQTMNDANRIDATGAKVVQVNTGTGCHLDSDMINQGSKKLELKDDSILFIENVGNLVCPASFQLGTHQNILIASIPEGDDKPYKYPTMYRGVDALVINKIDLLPYIDFDMQYFQRGVEVLNPGLITFPISCRTGEGLDGWLDWLKDQVTKHKSTHTT